MSNRDRHKSSYSANGGNCVETRGAHSADVLDTQHREAGYLSSERTERAALVRSASHP